MKKQDAIEKIKKIADKYSSFKIGETGQRLKDRFDTEYKKKYDKILPICKSTQKDLIDILEKYLIEYFQKDKDYKSKCSNEASGGGDMEDSDEYRIYVVVKK